LLLIAVFDCHIIDPVLSSNTIFVCIKKNYSNIFFIIV
jgi:hypothetical protein